MDIAMPVQQVQPAKDLLADKAAATVPTVIQQAAAAAPAVQAETGKHRALRFQTEDLVTAALEYFVQLPAKKEHTVAGAVVASTAPLVMLDQDRVALESAAWDLDLLLQKAHYKMHLLVMAAVAAVAEMVADPHLTAEMAARVAYTFVITLQKQSH